MSFVYDIADIYKADTTIPAAFEAVKKNRAAPENHVRDLCRKYFHATRLMQRIAKDIAWLFEDGENEHQDFAGVGDLWDEDGSTTPGGINHAGDGDEYGCAGD